jgi:hypothetical protein
MKRKGHRDFLKNPKHWKPKLHLPSKFPTTFSKKLLTKQLNTYYLSFVQTAIRNQHHKDLNGEVKVELFCWELSAEL